MHRFFVVAGICLCLLAAACASDLDWPDSDPPATAPTTERPPDTPLALPNDLSRSVSAYPVHIQGRVKLGSDADLGLSLNSQPDGGLVWAVVELYRRWFIPQESVQIGNGVPVAYHAYSFRPVDYNGPLEFFLAWEQPPQANDIAFALADFATNSWQWFECEDPAYFGVPDDPRFHSADGEVFLLLFLTNERALLKWIKLGSANAAPFAGLAADSTTAPQGQVFFDTLLETMDVDGEVVKREFDFDGDGTFEVDNGNEPDAMGFFESEGDYTISMRATDDEGLTAVATIQITVNDWHSEFLGNVTSLGDLEIDSSDILQFQHRLYDKELHKNVYYYSRNEGSGWQSELVDEQVLGDDHVVLLALDAEEVPTLLTSGDLGYRLIQRTASGWQLSPVPPHDFAEMPYNARIELEFDSANHPHLAAGTDLYPGYAYPGDFPSYTVRYWSYDGAEWILQYEHDSGEEFLGLELDESGLPCLGYVLGSTVVAYLDPQAGEWRQQTISDDNIANGRILLQDDGTLHAFSIYQGRYFVREAGEWREGPDPGLLCFDLQSDSAGKLLLLQGKDDVIQVATLEGNDWISQQIKYGGIGELTRASAIRTTSDGVVHVTGAMDTLYDRRYFALYPGFGPDLRIMHYWK